MGTQEFLPLKLLGGAFGWGLKRNVIELYEFLCRNYECGDDIYLFGFSRGAFTARMLAGFIQSEGLYRDYRDEKELRRAARRRFSAYLLNYRTGYVTLPFRWLLNKRGGRGKVTTWVDIKFIGVWDTVEAYGFPVDELSRIWNRVVHPLRFGNQTLPCNVKQACHALAVDEERLSFHPVLWDEGPTRAHGARAKDRFATIRDYLRKTVRLGKIGSRVKKERAPKGNYENIEQVWFPGVHADVGGGYPMNSLSLVTLDWMISKVERSLARPHGLRFFSSARDKYVRRCDWHGKQHDSRSGLAAYYRYRPRDIEQICKDRKISVPKIHRSVFERIRQEVVPYCPTSLPGNYTVTSTRGKLRFKSQYETAVQSGERVRAMNGALDVVFWRCGLYYALVAVTGLVLASAVSEPAQWLDVSWQNPWWKGAILVALAMGCAKRRTYRATQTRAAAAWSSLKRGAPPTGKARWTSLLRRCLKRQPLPTLFKWFLPTVVFLVLAFMALSVVSRSAYSVRAHFSQPCVSTEGGGRPPEDPVSFPILEPCYATGISLKKGVVYRLEVKSAVWSDGRMKAGPNGRPRLVRLPAALNRRHLSEPWLKLMGRVGANGHEAFAIGAGPILYRARSDGELFLYVNDAVLGVPWWGDWWAWPYRWSAGSNRGTATVTVSRE